MNLPDLAIYNRQRKVRIDLPLLRGHLLDSLPDCAKRRGPGASSLAGLSQVEISLVGERVLSSIHEEFLGDPSPTDVITFPYGEILVSAPRAQSVADEEGIPVQEEILRYCIHGLLHLHGWLDDTPARRKNMIRRQEEILRETKRGL
jgi:probable rRNA maturation factor